MKRIRTLGFILLTIMLIILAACGDSSDETPRTTDPDFIGDVTEVHPLGNNGVVGTILVEAEVTSQGNAYLEKYVVTINDETTILIKDGRTAEDTTFDAIETGQQVQVWFDGPVKESFPMQVDAAQIMIVGQPEGDKVYLGQEFQLSIGQKTMFSDVNLSMELVSIEEDSRCPRDVTCVWQGEVSAKFKLLEDDNSNLMILTQPGLHHGFSKEIYGGYEILFKVLPYPAADEPIASEDYSVVMILTEVSNEETGTLRGHVTIGPIEPVVRPGDDPSDIPPEVYDARKIMVFNESGDILMEQVDIEHNGIYNVELIPGMYLVDINRLGIDYSSEVPRVVEIQAGKTIHMDIDIDTGIR